MAKATLVGLHSGKELLVQPTCYQFPDLGKNIFLSLDGNRLYTIPDENIEFVDEEATEERLNALSNASKMEVEVVVADDRDYI